MPPHDSYIAINRQGPLVDPVAAVTSSGYMDVPFTWTADGAATSYRLEIGTATGAHDTFFSDVGNVTSYTVLQLAPGTYYWVVRTMTSGTPGTATAEQIFYV